MAVLDKAFGAGIALTMLAVAATFIGAAYVSYGVVYPMVPATEWAWLVAGVTAIVVGYIAAQIVAIVLSALTAAAGFVVAR